MVPSTSAATCPSEAAYVGAELLPTRRPGGGGWGADSARLRARTSLTRSAIAVARACSVGVKWAVRRTWTATSPTVISITSCTGPSAPSTGSASASNRPATTSGKLAGWASIGAGGQHVAHRLVDQRVLGARRPADRRTAGRLDQPGDVDQAPVLGDVQHQLVGDGLDPGEDLQAEDVHPGGTALACQRGQRTRSVGKRATHAPQVHAGPLSRLRPHSTSVAHQRGPERLRLEGGRVSSMKQFVGDNGPVTTSALARIRPARGRDDS